MKGFSTASLLSLSLLVPSSWQTPVGHVESHRNYVPNNANPLSEREVNGRGLLANGKCDSPWIKIAERLADHVPHHEVATLCSSHIGKYKTVTTTQYTATVTPTTTVHGKTTAPRATISTTKTVQVTNTATSGVTVVVTQDVTDVQTIITTIATQVVTVTQSPPVVSISPRGQQDICRELAQILHVGEYFVPEFCSCYASGPTSTITVTKKAAKTAQTITVTKPTATVTLAPVIITATVTKTATLVQPITVVVTETDTITQTTTDSVTATSTTTVAPVPTNLIQLDMPGTPYDGLYGFLDDSVAGGRPLQFISDVNLATTFMIDASLHLGTTKYLGEQIASSNPHSPSSDAVYFPLTASALSAAAGGQVVLPACTLSGTRQLIYAEDRPFDPRKVLSICPSTKTVFGGIYPRDTPFLVLSASVLDGCTVATLRFT